MTGKLDGLLWQGNSVGESLEQGSKTMAVLFFLGMSHAMIRGYVDRLLV